MKALQVFLILANIGLLGDYLGANPVTGIVSDSLGNIWFARHGEEKIYCYHESGKTKLVVGGAVNNGISNPHHLYLDRAENLYSAEDSTGIVWKITPDHTLHPFYLPIIDQLPVGKWGAPFTLDEEGYIYAVLEQENEYSLIVKIDRQAKADTLAGGNWGYRDGAALEAQFSNLGAGFMMLDKNGDLYLADGLCRIRKIDGQGNVTTIAGGEEPGFADGKAGSARFDQPLGMTFDEERNLLVADHGNNLIRKIRPDGEVSTVAMLPGASGVTIHNGILYVLGESNGETALFKIQDDLSPQLLNIEIATVQGTGGNFTLYYVIIGAVLFLFFLLRISGRRRG